MIQWIQAHLAFPWANLFDLAEEPAMGEAVAAWASFQVPRLRGVVAPTLAQLADHMGHIRNACSL